MYNTQNIANRIKATAKSKKISIKNMLSDLTLGINTISQFAKGQVMSSINLARIADYLECSVDYLLGRTDDPTWHKPNETLTEKVQKTPIIIEKKKHPKPPKIRLPLYPQSVSAGTGNYLFDSEPEYIDVEKSSKTVEADFLVRVSGDSMLPKYHNGDVVLVKQIDSIQEGEIGIFFVDGDSFIKQMGSGDLISLNPDYPNIPLKDYNNVHCFGQVIGILDV